MTSVQGTAHFETGGGNITLEHSGAELAAETGGGEITVGEAAGVVRAHTSGGGIKVVRTFGPTDLETSGGSIYLTQVDSAVKASTSDGGITAWFVAPKKAPGVCELQSSSGDIIVHLPRELPVTIDALVMHGGDHRVIVDPAFPLKVSYDDLKGSHTVRAEGDLNGGGELLKVAHGGGKHPLRAERRKHANGNVAATDAAAAAADAAVATAAGRTRETRSRSRPETGPA